VALISALYGIAITIGAPRVVAGTRIEHVCGDPKLGDAEGALLQQRIVRTSLQALQTEVEHPTLFTISESEEE
jgi:glycine/betaine/sarcosine/D-proline reductase family selenoprotein B